GCGALNRLERDVLSRNPTVVTVCFGMNDGHYARINDEVAATYRKNLDAVVKNLDDKKIRVVIFSPPPVDEAMQPPWLSFPLKDVEYNKTLQAFRDICSEIAKKYGSTYIDIGAPILKTLAALKVGNPSPGLLRDGVHPDEKGGFVMAGAMLLAMGAEPMPYLADTTAAQLTGPDKSGVPVAGPVPVPLWMNDDDAAFAKAAGFLDVAALRLRVRGLAAGRYEVRIADAIAGLWNADELRQGVLIPGGFSNRAKRIYDVTNWKEANYFNAWRVVNLDAEKGAATDGAVQGLLQADDGFQAAIDSLNTPISGLTVTVKSTGLPENVGQNLALKKPYEASDPNVYNYGYGGLTDSSWVNENPHVFATGEKDTFPKTATVDLGKVQPLTNIYTGVPAFGSTKTVTVSLSSDNTNFTEVGTYVFKQRQEERHLFGFKTTPARYVRLTFPDHYPDEAGYNNRFSFINELEVYGPRG
ncbi:hypothetical protein EON80_03530, partial [bacterium]